MQLKWTSATAQTPVKDAPSCIAYCDTALSFASTLKRTINVRLFAFAIIAVSFCSCNPDQKFEKTSWQQRDDLGMYPNRAKMLNDLVNNHQLKGLTYKQLIDFLGEPEKYSDEEPNTLTYNIVTDYKRDIDPVYIKNLEVKLNSDRIVTEVNINKIKH